MRRKSRYCLALGNLLKLGAARLVSTSQSATMFSLLTLLRSDAPCPPMPMQAMLSLLFGEGVEARKPRTELGTMEMVARAAVVLRRNPRRVVRGAGFFIVNFQPARVYPRNLDLPQGSKALIPREAQSTSNGRNSFCAKVRG